MNFDAWKEIKKLIHYTKEKQKVIYKPMMEESTEQVETNLESSNPPTNSNTQQLCRDPITAEQPSTPKELASIKDDSIGNHQLSSSINENYILSVLNDLPEQWIGKEMNLHAIATKKDTIWIVNRVLQDVERGLINAQFKVEEFNHLCDITFTLKIVTGLASFPSAVTAINPVFSFILSDIKSETISRTKRKFSTGSYH
ncbi:MAG TPA: hypothetical protein VEL11_12110 [Candidatus Bathyarchaeia archaeon]|nr:hypothetical protein [Candidatus Bathyarchaeia archaeon]